MVDFRIGLVQIIIKETFLHKLKILKAYYVWFDSPLPKKK